MKLKRLIELRMDMSSGSRPCVFLEHVGSGTGKLLPHVLLPDRPASAVGFVAAEPGDLLFGKLRPYLAKTWSVDRPAYASTELLCLRPRADVDSRWLGYLMASKSVIEWSMATSDGVRMPRTSWEKLGQVDVFIPVAAEQRAIANFLDGETARIDSLIVKKQNMLTLLSERAAGALDHVMSRYGFRFPRDVNGPGLDASVPPGWRVVRLGQVLRRLTNGYVGPTRDILVDSGVRYIQSLHIKDGVIDFDRRPFFVTQEWHQSNSRINLRPGDVLIVQTGDIGNVAVVPEDFGPASCHALQIARVREDFLSGVYLAEYLRTSFGYQSLISRATGALHPHLEGSIRDVPVVLPPLNAQLDVVEQVNNARRRERAVRIRLKQQIDLLKERRQALITAAVTGEMEVLGVSR